MSSIATFIIILDQGIVGGAYSPSFDFSDPLNSQYFVMGWP